MNWNLLSYTIQLLKSKGTLAEWIISTEKKTPLNLESTILSPQGKSLPSVSFLFVCFCCCFLRKLTQH
jgi:hypothetical protein